MNATNITSGWPGDCYLLNYDIPEGPNGPVFENPSWELRQIGTRFNLSCWLIPAVVMPWGLIESMRAQGCNVKYALFAPGEKETLQGWVRQGLTDELTRLHTSLIDNIGRAVEQYEEAQRAIEASECPSDKARLKATLYREQRCKQILAEAKKGIDAAIMAAELFDETMSVDHLIEALRTALAAKTSAHLAEVDARRLRFSDYKEVTRTSSGIKKLKWQGIPVTQLLRWMGSQQWDMGWAKDFLNAQNLEVVESTIKEQLRLGARGSGPVATPSKDQLEILNRYAG